MNRREIDDFISKNYSLIANLIDNYRDDEARDLCFDFIGNLDYMLLVPLRTYVIETLTDNFGADFSISASEYERVKHEWEVYKLQQDQAAAAAAASANSGNSSQSASSSTPPASALSTPAPASAAPSAPAQSAPASSSSSVVWLYPGQAGDVLDIPVAIYASYTQPMPDSSGNIHYNYCIKDSQNNVYILFNVPFDADLMKLTSFNVVRNAKIAKTNLLMHLLRTIGIHSLMDIPQFKWDQSPNISLDMESGLSAAQFLDKATFAVTTL